MIASKSRRPLPDNEWDGFGWVGSPLCELKGDDERLLIARRADIELVGGIVDETLSYEYDEFALVLLDGCYYLLETAGCSCPSPAETWTVVSKGTLDHIRATLLNGEYRGYTLPVKKQADFFALIDNEMRPGC